MSTDVSVTPLGPVTASSPGARREVIYRHALLLRLTHWINALCVFLLIGTGLNIFNAHPLLYWGEAGDPPDRPLLAIGTQHVHSQVRGLTQLGPLRLDTTGLLGWSRVHGQWAHRAWPAWITIPSNVDLADARHWHFFIVWVLMLNGLVYLAWSLAARHIQRDLWPTRRDLRDIPRSVLEHLRNRHPRGEAAKRYNVLQKLAYLGLIVLVVGMVATGAAMSPGLDAAVPWLLTVLGGRQSARTLHFLFASGIVLFIAVHVAEVVLAGPLNEVRSIVTGRYAVPPEHS